METIKNNKVLSGVLVVVLLIILSATILFATGRFSEQASYVEVKGLSEKIVKADTAIWSMNFEVKSNDIDSLYAETERNITAIKTFLKGKGFEDSEINVAAINIYQDTYRDAIYRYNSNDQVSVYTKKVDLAKAASNETLLLVKKGVVLNQNSINFEFSDINSIKPEMLTDAIKNARATAEQFSDNAGVSLGQAVRGNQGVFEITDKDPGSPEYKKIRLVSTLRFLIN
ncbi:MAG: SIMPL domain-containing protein [bacterium]